MKRVALFFLGFFVINFCFSWGPTGHRVVGEIAESLLTKRAKKNIQAVLGHETLAEVSNYMDFIKSDTTRRHMDAWHYMTIPDSLIYHETIVPEAGDVYQTIVRLIAELKNKEFSDDDESFALKCLVHLVGDIHQPLHVGNGTDRGGNDVAISFFWSSSNLHRAWDSGIIDQQKLSYTEYTNWINHPSKNQIKDWQADDIIRWVEESKSYHGAIYNLPAENRLSYRYVYDHLETVNLRLLQAGVRLAGILNEIYG